MDNNFNGQNFNPQSNLNNTQYTVNTVPIIPNNNYGAVPGQNYANVQQPQQFGNAQQPQQFVNVQQPQQFGNMQQPYVMPQGYPQARQSKPLSGGAIAAIVIGVILLVLGPIIAAIAIPIIVTTNNSSKLSVLESDTSTVNMLCKEAVNTYLVNSDTYKYNGKTAAEATVGDVLIENQVDYDSDFLSRTIGGYDYYMGVDDDGDIVVCSYGGGYGASGQGISAETKITYLATFR